MGTRNPWISNTQRTNRLYLGRTVWFNWKEPICVTVDQNLQIG